MIRLPHIQLAPLARLSGGPAPLLLNPGPLKN